MCGSDTESNQKKGYEAAYALAVERLRDMEPESVAGRCEVAYDAQACEFAVPYLGSVYGVGWPGGEVRRVGGDEEVSLTNKVLLLEYLTTARRQPPTGELIAFREIPGASNYEPSFNKRAMLPLVKTFDGKPDLLLSAARKLAGDKASIADASVVIKVLPLLEVTYGVWNSDEDFPATGVILIDRAARRLMSAECLIVAASGGVYELIRLARSLGQ